LQPDLIHVNDWQTGLIPALLKTEYSENPLYREIASLLTIHNMAYQGLFPADHMSLTGMDQKYFNWEQMEFHGQLNFLKAGLVFADAINTVSPTYAREIQTVEQGCGLERVLQERSGRLFGIINVPAIGIRRPIRICNITSLLTSILRVVAKAKPSANRRCRPKPT